jgi:hypothetical protein
MTGDPNSPVVLAVMATDAEASMLVSRLADQGIKAIIAGGGSALGPAIFVQGVDVQVVVRRADHARATELLEIIEQERLPEEEASEYEEE